MGNTGILPTSRACSTLLCTRTSRMPGAHQQVSPAVKSADVCHHPHATLRATNPFGSATRAGTGRSSKSPVLAHRMEVITT
eukprot:7067590-Pyramimonas_sp.AAC.1